MFQDLKIFAKGIIKPHKLARMTLDLMRIGLNPLGLSAYLFELLLDSHFRAEVNKKINEAQQFFPDPKLGGWMLGFPGVLLYPVVRMTKPKTVIETGVGPGGSSALILNALSKNKQGHLYSIDLPGYDSVVYPKIGRCYNIHIPPGYEVGWLIPSWLKDRWTLFVGDSKQKLPALLNSLDSVDLFLHDSLHTDEHVIFELNTVFPKLSKTGIILADDVNEYWTLAFVKFCEDHGLPYIVVGHRLGIAIKV